ncbi:MAG: DUF4336 domain-containing protein [Leptospiraceae bacterium]|nr:DUF4336 domain-containing protein [Leptospiraceae bacterium]
MKRNLILIGKLFLLVMLHTVAPDIWTMDGESIRFFGIPFPLRMTIVRLPDQRLWLHSPVRPSKEQLAALQVLGSTAFLVAPNAFHHLYIGHWQEHFPEAQIWGVSKLKQKRPELHFSGILDETAETPWQPHIEQIYFRGSAILPEMMFWHRSTKTLILTDYIQNHDTGNDGWFWRRLKRIIGVEGPQGGVPLDLRLSVWHRRAARDSLQQLMQWDFERIIIAHGNCIEGNGREYLQKAFEWLQ